MPSIALFVYGTLRDPELVRSLTGHTFPTRPARLDDHQRITPARGYPYLVPQPGATVDGLLLDGIDPVSLARLDAYEEEGTLYRRRTVRVNTEAGEVAAEAYLGDAAAHRRRYG